MENVENHLSFAEKNELISTLAKAESDGTVAYNAEEIENNFMEVYYSERKKRAA